MKAKIDLLASNFRPTLHRNILNLRPKNSPVSSESQEFAYPRIISFSSSDLLRVSVGSYSKIELIRRLAKQQPSQEEPWMAEKGEPQLELQLP
jgi:hypothetical protein